MREILFRGRKNDNGEWAEGSLILAEDFCCILEAKDKVHPMDYPYFDGDIGIIDGNVTPVDPATVGQYTGLKDKNGRKIFEFDILTGYFDGEHGKTNAVVVFYEGSWETHMYNDGFLGLLDEAKKVEVVGNIHDNPELFEEAK